MISENPAFFFDFSAVLARCEASGRSPERIKLMFQNQVRALAPYELLIPRETGLLLVMQTRFGAAAEALVGEINVALLRKSFGSDYKLDSLPIFRPVRHGEFVEFGPVSRSFSAPVGVHRNAAHALRQPVQPVPSRSAEFKPGLLPIFDLRQDTPPLYLCGPVSIGDGKTLFGSDALKFCHPQYRLSVHIAMLEYAMTLLPHEGFGRRASAIVTSVSYETLAWLRSRRQYVDALRAAGLSDNSRIVVKIDDVPCGIPVRRLAEVVAILKPVVKRIFVQLPDRDNSLTRSACIGAEGFCAALGAKAAMSEIASIASRLRKIAAAQDAHSCIMGLADGAALDLARNAGIRLASRRPDRDGIHLGGLPDIVTPTHAGRAA